MFRPKGSKPSLFLKRLHQKRSEERDYRGISADENTVDSSCAKQTTLNVMPSSSQQQSGKMLASVIIATCENSRKNGPVRIENGRDYRTKVLTKQNNTPSESSIEDESWLSIQFSPNKRAKYSAASEAAPIYNQNHPTTLGLQQLTGCEMRRKSLQTVQLICSKDETKLAGKNSCRLNITKMAFDIPFKKPLEQPYTPSFDIPKTGSALAPTRSNRKV